MTFVDMIKESVLENFTAVNISVSTILITLAMSAAMGMFIYVVYRLNTRSGFYNRGFNKTLATMPVITAGIMLALQSSFLISLGMVGALSIVRFRNAVKDTSDLAYLFWSISMGMIIGANQHILAIVLSLGVAAMMTFLDLLPTLRAPCLLVISGEAGIDEAELMSCVKNHCARAKVRSRNLSKRGKEWIIELQAKDGGALVDEVGALQGVVSVNLLSHDGEVRF